MYYLNFHLQAWKQKKMLDNIIIVYTINVDSPNQILNFLNKLPSH